MSLNSAKGRNTLKYWYSWIVQIRNTSRQYSGHNTPLGHYTDCSPMGLGQYNGLGEYCSPHTASSVFLILLHKAPSHSSRLENQSSQVILLVLPIAIKCRVSESTTRGNQLNSVVSGIDTGGRAQRILGRCVSRDVSCESFLALQ